MKLRSVGLVVVISALAVAGAGSLAQASSSSCGLTFRVHPGVGETLVSQVRVTGVTCGQAQFAIGRYEHSLKHTAPLKVGGQTFTCTRTRIGSPELGLTSVSCRKGAKRVSWRAAYGI
jgi:hypothetical protein